MLIQRAMLAKIIDHTRGDKPASPDTQTKFGKASVVPKPAVRVRLLRDEVAKCAKTGALVLHDRTAVKATATLSELRGHPLVRVAYLESLLHDMAHNKPLTAQQFQAALVQEGLDDNEPRVFSLQDKLAAVDYLQNTAIPVCYASMTGDSPELTNAATVLYDLKAKLLAQRMEGDTESSSGTDSDSGFVSASDQLRGGKKETSTTRASDKAKVVASKQAPQISAEQLKQQLLDGYRETISVHDLESIMAELPEADWSNDRLVQELVWFSLCNRFGANLKKTEFAKLHNEGKFTDEMLTHLKEDRRGRYFSQTMMMAAIQLRNIATPPPKRTKTTVSAVTSKPSPLTHGSADTPASSSGAERKESSSDSSDGNPSTLAASFKEAGVPEQDQSILLAGIKRLTKSIMDKLRALYRAMTVTGERFTAEECALLVNSGVVNADALDRLPRSTMKELRATLVAIQESQLAAPVVPKPAKPTTPVQPPAPVRGDRRIMEETRVETDTAVPQAKPDEAAMRIDKFYKTLSTIKDERGQPLVSSKAECELLCAGLEQTHPRPLQLVKPLKYFRNMQFHEKAADVSFTSRMFPALLLGGALDNDPTVVQLDMAPDVLSQMKAAGMDLEADGRREKLHMLANQLLKQDNFEPDVAGDMRMRAEGLQPSGSGLFNYSNNCFMNSTLQAVADSWETSGILNGLRHEMPVYALYNMLDSLYGRGLTGAARETKIWNLVQRIRQNPQSLHDRDMPPRAAETFAAYERMRTSFLALCDGLNNRRGEATTLVHEQKAFFEAYREYGEMRGKVNVSYLLQNDPGQKVVFGRIPQQDPEEFFTTLVESMGIDLDPRYGIGSGDSLGLYRDGQLVDEKIKPVHYTAPRIAIPLVGQTLQSAIEGFGEEEMLDRNNQMRWDPLRLQQLGIQQDARTTTSKKLALSAKQPPKQLALQMKLFSNYGIDGKALGGQSRYMKQEGQQLLKNLQLNVNVPMNIQQDGRTTSVNVPYQVKSVVCHRGDSLRSGHYMTLKFQGDQVIVCDDDIVADMQTYARFHGQQPYTSWQDFCEREKLTPYLISTVRAN